MREIARTIHGVSISVELYEDGLEMPFISVGRFRNFSQVHEPDTLREIGEAFIEVADEWESHDDVDEVEEV